MDMYFRQLLRPFADYYSEAEMKIQSKIKSMSADELKELVEACGQPTKTNCWYAIYEVAPIVKTYANYYIREKEKAPAQS